MDRLLIVNADDFGMSEDVNRGILKAHFEGIVTSASLMVRWPDAAEAADYGRKHPGLSVGLHFDTGEWTCRNGEWSRLADGLNQQIHDVAAHPNGDVIAVGQFTSAGDATIYYVARRTETGWEPFGDSGGKGLIPTMSATAVSRVNVGCNSIWFSASRSISI